MSRYTIIENSDDDWMLEHKRMDIERKKLAELDKVVRENNALREQRDFLIKENENLQLKIEEAQQLEQTQRFLLQASDAYKSQLLPSEGGIRVVVQTKATLWRCI